MGSEVVTEGDLKTLWRERLSTPSRCFLGPLFFFGLEALRPAPLSPPWRR
jgi:hypothetical protein